MTKDGLYILVADGSEKKLYKMGDTRVETYFECILPLFREDLSVKRLSALSLHLEVKSYCYLSVALLSENESGQTFSRTFQLRKCWGDAGFTESLYFLTH